MHMFKHERLFGAKPIPDLLLIYCPLHRKEQASVNLNQMFQWEKCIKISSANGGPFLKPQFVQ